MTTKRRPKTRLEKDAHIAIIGSGLAGLGAALSLEQAGFTNISVFERDACPESRREGYGLTLTYNPNGPLAQMGLLEQVAQRDCPSRSHYLFSPNGSILGYYGNTFQAGRGLGQRGNLRVPRLVLRQLLLDRVLSKVHWNKRLVSFERCQDDDTKIHLQFEDDVCVKVDFLVGADGIHSRVIKTLLREHDEHGLRYLKIMIILGIADFCHPLLDERGFYTLDGTHRLFTMPYEGTKLDKNHKRRIMWQLSYRLDNEAEAKRLSTSGPTVLREEVLRLCRDWHEPVADMIAATPLETIWGTGLMDRDPKKLLRQISPKSIERVVVLGDAVHPMSPFKGQGANQALADGPLLASWLQRSSVDAAVSCFWREMIQRTSCKVQASREAAALLHSPQVLQESQDFAGVKTKCIANLLATLDRKGINTNCGAKLDELVQETIDDLECSSCNADSAGTSQEYHEMCKLALALAADGDSTGLRNLSLQHCDAICHARDHRGRSCLHLAAAGGHYSTCRWLLTEASVSPDSVDKDTKSPRQVAAETGQDDIAALLAAPGRR